MKTTLIGIAASAALSLFGLPAHANCAYPSGGNHPDIQLPAYHHQHFGDHEGIVGTWLVNYGPCWPSFHSMAQRWH